MINDKDEYSVFVYGTLRPKDGEGNYIPSTHRLWGYAMYNYGAFPYIEKSDYGNDYVVGNIMEVSEEQLKQLDYYEGVPSNLYYRAVEDVEQEGGVMTQAFVYVGDGIIPARVCSGDWSDV